MFKDLKEELKDCKFLKNKKEIINNLKVLLTDSCKKYNNIAIAFSGGIDSALLALLTKNPILYTIGLENSEDISWSIKVAKQLNCKIKTKVLTLKEAEEIIKKVTKILKSTDVTQVGIASVLYSVLEIAKKDKVKTILTGLGAEELFGGYMRHINYGKDLKNIHKNLWNGINTLETRDLARDLPIAKHFKINLETPFLDKELVGYSMKIHPSLKINKENKKIILRETALKLGLNKEVAYRKKIAAQYSSKFDRAMKKIAKQKGFKLKKDYLRTLLISALHNK